MERVASGVIPVAWGQMTLLGVNREGERETGSGPTSINHRVKPLAQPPPHKCSRPKPTREISV